MRFDWASLLIVIPAMVFAFWASRRVEKTFQKYQSQHSINGISGAQAARRILDANGLANVPIDLITGRLSDNYDPTANVVRLSQDVFHGTSTAAIGIACHEVGHALQYATSYAPVRFRMAIIPATRFGSRLAVPLIIGGLLLSSLSSVFVIAAYIGVAFFALSTIFQLITLPVEMNASKRALQQIQANGILYSSEMQGAKEVLNAAALTYVAALAVSITQLIRFLMILRRRR